MNKVYTDTERLDFLTQNTALRVKSSDDKGWIVWDCSKGLTIAGEGKTSRDAIDAATTKLTAKERA